MTKITESLFMIPGRDEMIPDAHVYLIGKPGSADLSLVDAGLMGHGAYKLKELAADGVKPTDIKRIIMTHTHLDHIGCLKELMDAMPTVEVWVHENEAGPLEAGDDRTVYGMDMFKQMCQTQYRLKEGDFKFKVNRYLKEGRRAEPGRGDMDCPAHTRPLGRRHSTVGRCERYFDSGRRRLRG